MQEYLGEIGMGGKSSALKSDTPAPAPAAAVPSACCVSLDELLPFSGSFLDHKQKIQTKKLNFFLALLFYD